jgi:hypothetical protein
MIRKNVGKGRKVGGEREMQLPFLKSGKRHP